MRRDSNFLLTTILWGNVGTNVLLTLLSDSVMAGVVGFVFSTFVITFGGEILPQAYFSRNALRMATLLRHVLRFYQLVLYPIAKPTAMLLDAWLGPEGIQFVREVELRESLKRHIVAPQSDVGRVEGIGALNFLALDDLPVSAEGEPLDPRSIIVLPVEGGRPVFPAFERSPDDPFLRQVNASGHKWVVVTSPDDDPALALDADGFLRDAFLGDGPIAIEHYCHRPILVRDPATELDEVLPRFNVDRQRSEDDVVDDDLILVWGAERRVITGADLLGRLLRGIARPAPTPPPPPVTPEAEG
jgi:CBS domain containing-hemolysin-like protein